MNYKVFAHFVNIPGAMYIAHSLVHGLIRSNLIIEADIELRLHYENNNEFGKLVDSVSKYPRVTAVRVNADKRDYEMPTLIRLKEFCDQSTEETYVLYIHHKGVTHPDNPCVSDWRTLMTFFMIDNWKMAIKFLNDGYDTVGVNYRQNPNPHYSGNFWWTKSSYVKRLQELTLPSCVNYKSQLDLKLLYPEVHRFDSEMWVCSANPNAKCVHESGVNHYIQRYSM